MWFVYEWWGTLEKELGKYSPSRGIRKADKGEFGGKSEASSVDWEPTLKSVPGQKWFH